MMGLLVNKELKRTWKEEAKAQVELLTRHGPGVLRKAERISVRISSVLVEI
jgi:hypothetical protein